MRIRFTLSVLICLGPIFSSSAHAQTSPADFITPEYEANWGLPVVNAANAYALGFTGAGIKIGIADSPTQYTHPEFAGRVYWPTPQPAFPVPDETIPSHGTHVTGIAAAARNGVGMMGVAFDASIALAQATNAAGYPAVGDWSESLVQAGVSVMNGSFGPPAFPDTELADGSPNPNYVQVPYLFVTPAMLENNLAHVQTLADADVVMVFAAGNEFDVQPLASKIPSGSSMLPLVTPTNTQAGNLYRVFTDDSVGNDPSTWEAIPLDEPELANADLSYLAGSMISVVSLTQTGMAAYSNECGAAAAWCIAAPGSQIYSTLPMSTYGTKSGTSMASPMVAGAAALVRQAFPYMTARQVIEVILTTATPLGDPSLYGHGLLNAGRAVLGPIEFGSDPIFASTFAIDTKGYDSVWGNNITGSGGMSKAGAGLLRLTGQNTYTGTTLVTGGTLQVDGSISSSNLTVTQGATLSGAGTVGSTVIHGTIAPGDSVGTLSVDGDLVLGNGSIYAFEVGSDQQSDLIMVSGDVVIEDTAKLQVELSDGAYFDNSALIIYAKRFIGKVLEPVSDKVHTFIDLVTAIEGQSLTLTLQRNGVSMLAFAQTANQRAVAQAIENQRAGAEPFDTVILNSDPTQLPSSYQAWSGEIYSANQAVLLSDGRLLSQTLNWRLQDSWLDDPATSRLQRSGNINEDTTAWLQAYGNWDKFNADASADSATANSNVFMLGIDHAITDKLRLGGAFGATVTQTNVADSEAQTSGYHLMLYGTGSASALRISGGLIQSWYNTDVNRTLPSGSEGNATGAVSSQATQAFVDVGIPLKLQSSTLIQPYVQVSQTWLHQANFSENGSAAALSGQATTAVTGFGVLGSRLLHRWQSNETIWQAQLGLGWQRGWGDLAPTTTMAFTSGPAFTVTAAPIAKDALLLELGIGANLGPSSRLSLTYSASFAGQSQSQMLQAQMQWKF